jgi:AraC-like DNA-binding protein
MQPMLEKILSDSLSSIAVKRELVPFMDYPLHYHPEFEIIFVEKSYGIRLMGNHIGNFRDKDLVFISPNLPHVWKNDNDFYQNNENLMVDVYVIHFREDSLGKGFFDLPEFIRIRNLFRLGQQGLYIKGRDQKKISDLIKEVYHTTGIERLILFLKTLEAFAETKEYNLLSSPGYINLINQADTERINKVVNFLLTNFSRDISTDEIADLVHLNKSSFCRYFKSRTNKTCSRLLNEIRIGNACKLLVNNKMRISEACYESGYKNISNFNKNFRYITGLTAKEYIKKYTLNAYS